LELDDKERGVQGQENGVLRHVLECVLQMQEFTNTATRKKAVFVLADWI